jgi:hypothetical protein
MAILRLIAKIRIKTKCSEGDVWDCTMAVSPYMTSEEVHLERAVKYRADGVKEYILHLHSFFRAQHTGFVMMRWCRHSGTRIKHSRFFWQLTCWDKWNQASSLKKRDSAAGEYPQYRRHVQFLSRIVSSCTDVHLCVVVQTYFRRSLCWWIWDGSVWLDVMPSRNIHYSVLCWQSWLHGSPRFGVPTTLCWQFLSSEMLHNVASNVTHPDISKERSALIFRGYWGRSWISWHRVFRNVRVF